MRKLSTERSILVTGATGFIGTRLVEALRHERGVIALARGPQPELEGVTWLNQDLARPLLLGDVQPELVIHLAHANTTDPEKLMAVNAGGTEALLAFAKTVGLERFILASTANVYGFGSRPFSETDTTPSGGSAYAMSKVMAEEAAWKYRNDFDVEILRLGTPYGKGQQERRMIPTIVDRVRRGKPVTLNNGVGNPRVTPIYVDDLVSIILQLTFMPGSRILNVAGDEHCSVRDLAERAGELFGIPPVFEDADAPGVGDLMLDTTCMRSLGLHAPTNLAAGLRYTFGPIA